MRYERIFKASFIERPNRFIAYVELDGRRETVHVKNTGRCAELLVPGAAVYIQKSGNPARKTGWDLIAVEKGERLINMDSQIPNRAAEEWIRAGGLFEHVTLVRPETAYGNSRFDLYVEAEEGEETGKTKRTGEAGEAGTARKRRIFVEVKGVTLEADGVCRFPDAPSERAVRHREELARAVKEGYEAYVLFVIQMSGVKYFTPNTDTHPAFAEALKRAKAAGVKILAYDCGVTPESIAIRKPVDVVLESPRLKECVPLLVEWYHRNRRDLPWRERMDAYRVWISEIMLQQTRVEAVKPYYERFLRELPDVRALAEVPRERLLKLWEGLGYYNRARNLQEAARQIMEEYGGQFPETFEEIRKLKGIGSYTAGAISSFVYHIPKPAVDGNVLRVVTRITADAGDIAKAGVKAAVEAEVEEVIPKDAPGDFNQSLIELGAIVCLPNGEPKCGECPVSGICLAHQSGREKDFPVKTKAKGRRIEKRTVLVIRDHDKTAIRKRPDTGLLAGMYEFPNTEGHLNRTEVVEYGKKLGLMPVRVKKLGKAKHIFSHVEWHMTGYEILVDELERSMLENAADPAAGAECPESPGDADGSGSAESAEDGSGIIFADIRELKERYPMPSAFEAFTEYALFS